MSPQISFKDNKNRIKKKLSFFEGGHQLEKLEFALAIAQTQGDEKKSIEDLLKIQRNKKIKFQRFMFTPELHTLNETMLQTKFRKKPDILSKFKSDALEYYYNIFDKYNFKNKMLKIIKENLCKEEDSEGEVVK